MIKLKKILTIFLLINLFFADFLFSANQVKASDIKTIIVTFSDAPTPASVSVTKTPLKYNKDFAWSYSFDDGLARGYDVAYKYMNGGYSSYLGQYFGGLYFTDGAGNNVPFRGGYAFYPRNSSYTDIHINTPSYINWMQLQETVDSGWNIFNHGYTSATVSDPENVYYIGDPGGHIEGPLDYNYELTQANLDIANKIVLKNNNGATTTPFNISQVILPNGDKNYIQPAFDNNFNAVYSQGNTFYFDGSTTTVSNFIDVTDAINENRHVMSRHLDDEYSYLPDGSNPGGLFDYVDNLALLSSGSEKYWGQSFTHQITTSTYYPDWKVGLTWNTWKSLMDHVENTYGRFGSDNVWVAGAEEVYNYSVVKQNTIINRELIGNQLTIELDVTNVPSSLRNKSLSLIINSDKTISSIDYGSYFAYHTDNKNIGLINLDWGDNAYSKNDLTRVESLVTIAESSKKKSDIDVARSYVNLLTTNPTSVKESYESRLDNIVVPLRTWYVNVNGVALSNCVGATTTKAYPSPNHPNYNWNYFTVGNDSSVSCGDLLNLRDSDNQASTISLSNTAPFKSGGLQSTATGNNSAIYPDAVIFDKAQIYSGVSTPAKIKIYGLESIKTYNIKLYGYTSATAASGDSAITNYTIATTTKELIVKTNLSNAVEFVNVLPVNNEIEITIMPKDDSWGYGALNAIEIKENFLAAPSSLSYNSPNTYTKNTAITPLLPTVTGEDITYSVSPSLPAGLSINSETGIISGTPTVSSGLATYTVTATNSGGSDSFGVVISVNNVAPSSLSYNSPNTYTKNTAITPLLPTVTGEDITYTVSPSLPAGLSIDSETGVISGTPTVSSGLATYTVTATNSGGSDSFGVVISVNEISYLLSYSAGPGGSLSGEISQSVFSGSSGSEVTAIADDGYSFVSWSDNLLTSSRIDSNVSGNLTVVAQFAVNEVSNSSPVLMPVALGTGLSSINVPMGATQNIDSVNSQGVNFLGYIDSQVDFMISKKDDITVSDKHSLKISNLDLISNIVTVIISSKPQTISLEKGETKEVDLNGDKKNDIKVTFVDVYINRAEITIASLENEDREDIHINKVNNVIEEERLLSQKINNSLIKRLAGNILLQVEKLGQAWYLDPISMSRYYLADGKAAYSMLRKFGLGIANDDLSKIPVAPESVLPDNFTYNEKTSSKKMINRLKGRILLQVENRGEAWYVSPQNGYRYYLKDGEAAYQIMRTLSIGIANDNIRFVPVKSLE